MLFSTKFNPKNVALNLLTKWKFSSLNEKERIAYVNLETKKVNDLILACELDLSARQLLDYADQYKKEGKTYQARFGNRWTTIAILGNSPAEWEFGIHALSAAGAKKIIQIGICGSLSEQIKIGDIIVAESIYINDDTSRVFTKDQIVRCKGEMFDFVKSNVSTMVPKEIPLHFCRMVSSPTFFGQTPEMLKTWSQFGQAVALDVGIFFVLCSKFGIEYLSLFAVVDEKLNNLDIFKLTSYPISKIFNNSDFLIKSLLRGIKQFNLQKTPV